MITQILQNVIQYLTEGFLRIFSPSDDRYPAIGFQPFEGEISYSNGYYN